jgi:hypothetical protein
VVYVAIAFAFATVLLGLAARWRQEDERELVRAPEEGAPYGPRELPTDGPVSPMRSTP